MINRMKTDLISSQIETCEHWVNLSRGEENPFGRFVFNYTGYQALTWLCAEYDVRDGRETIANCVEFMYAKNPRAMTELVSTKEFTNACDYLVKEFSGGMKMLDHCTNLKTECESDVAARKLDFLYVESKEYSPCHRVLALLQTIEQFNVNLSHFAKKDFDVCEKGARVFGEFVNCYINAIIPVFKKS